MKQALCGLWPKELRESLSSLGFKPFLADQILDWVYQKRVFSFDEMTNIGKEERVRLKEHFSFPTISSVRTQTSSDQETFKTLWKLEDGALIESVIIEAPQRRTLCVSSQVGCPAKCAFCASGKQGLKRHLTTSEIVEQVLFAKEISHIVFMGMGEPLENYEAVVRALHLLCHEKLFHFSKRRITISTVGVVPRIYDLAEEEIAVNLVLSLHAPNQRIRQKIIPYARKYPLEEILAAMDVYAARTKRDITFEYTLIAGINDHKEHAEELALLLGDRQCAVNLIPYNRVEGLRLKRPKTSVIESFKAILEAHHIVTTCRYTKGDDIAAACGQLALTEGVENECHQ